MIGASLTGLRSVGVSAGVGRPIRRAGLARRPQVIGKPSRASVHPRDRSGGLLGQHGVGLAPGLGVSLAALRSVRQGGFSVLGSALHAVTAILSTGKRIKRGLFAYTL